MTSQHPLEANKVEIQDTRIVFIPWINSDGTEGRGIQYPMCVCESMTTAKRLGKGKDVQGSNAAVSKHTAYRIDNNLYAPCRLVRSTTEDVRLDKLAARKTRILDKLRSAGLTDDDFKFLSDLIVD